MKKGTCCNCKKGKIELVYSQTKQDYVCYDCSKKIWEEKKAMMGKP